MAMRYCNAKLNVISGVLRDVEGGLRVNITIVYEHIVCATSAFSMCMLRVLFNVILF